jgi:hypothetical protein
LKNSDVPWIAGAAMVTVGGLYLASNQNLRHGSSHDTQAKAHKAQRQLDGENDAPSEKESTAGGHAASIVGAGKSSVDRPKHEPEPESQNGKSNEAMGHTKIQKKDDPSQPGAGRPDPGEEAGLVGHGPKESPKSMESGAAPPDVSDKPDPRGKPKSQNETSGKQEGLSNADTHHTSQVSSQPEKSKKGEGVAESAKLKGTVSTNRPGAENKEERGKAQMEKR